MGQPQSDIISWPASIHYRGSYTGTMPPGQFTCRDARIKTGGCSQRWRVSYNLSWLFLIFLKVGSGGGE